MVEVLVFVIGLCLGSFGNVVIYRLNHNLSPLTGRSVCRRCKRKIIWQDNIPILSFALLRGKCRWCHSPISWQYPLVELGMGLFYLFFFREGILFLFFSTVFIILFVSDLLYETIPDVVLLPAIGLSLIFYHSPASLISGLGAGLFFYFLHLITQGGGMGLGDVKLVVLLGLILGWPDILVCLFLAFLTGALWGVILILGKLKKFGQHLPFGPFLIGSWLAAYLWANKIISWYLNL